LRQSTKGAARWRQLAVRTGSPENLLADLGRIWRHPPPGIDQRA